MFATVGYAGDASDEQAVKDAYVYLLGRAIVIRQEHTDIREPGVYYNVIKYNPLGSADFVNPNLDVAYLEAWIAVDQKTPLLLEVPDIRDRYYVAQICNEWGDVIVNINERNFPNEGSGQFVFVAPGSDVEIPKGARRIELPSYKAKMLARVELKTDVASAVKRQHEFTLKALGEPVIEPAVEIPEFGNQDLPGVELFDRADDIINSALDISPIAPGMQAQVRSIQRLAADDHYRAQLDTLLTSTVVPAFLQYAVTKSGVFKNNWLGTLGTGNYGKDYWMRTSANLVGLWANTNDEVVYFVMKMVSL